MKVIFLDIDGVLNSQEYFINNHEEELLYNKLFYRNKNKISNEEWLKIKLLDIDFYKLQLVKYIISETDAKIVISSSWRTLKIYPLIEEYLVNQGLTIIGVTPYINGNRGKEIREYLKENNEIEDFIVLDDEIFEDFNELENNLIKTDFYNEGLTYEHVKEAINVLKLKK